MELRLTAVASPQAEYFGFGAVGHVDDTFEPPAFHDGPADGSEDQTVLAHFHETKISARIGANVNGEAVTVHLPRCHRLQVDVVAPLVKSKKFSYLTARALNSMFYQMFHLVKKLMNFVTVGQSDVRLAQ